MPSVLLYRFNCLHSNGIFHFILTDLFTRVPEEKVSRSSSKRLFTIINGNDLSIRVTEVFFTNTPIR